MADVYLTKPPNSGSITHVWRTAIQPNIAGLEERWSVYNWPRIEAENGYVFATRAKLNDIKAKLARFTDAVWGLPIWADLTTLLDDALLTTSTLVVESFDCRHFYEGRQLILISPFDYTIYEVCTIAALDQDSFGQCVITLEDGLDATWLIGSYVLPLYDMRIDSKQTLDGMMRTAMQFSLVFKEAFESARAFTYTLPAPSLSTYLDIPILLNSLNLEVDYEFSRPYDILQDIGIGSVIGRYAADQMQWRFTGNVNLRSRAAIWAFVQFFDYCQGKLNRFWVPSGANNIVPSQAIGSTDTVIHIDPIDYETNYLSNDLIGRYIFVRFAGGSYVCRKIIDADDITVTITLDSALGVAVPADQLDGIIISYLYLSRFDQDSLTIEYPGNRASRGRAKVAFTNLVEEVL